MTAPQMDRNRQASTGVAVAASLVLASMLLGCKGEPMTGDGGMDGAIDGGADAGVPLTPRLYAVGTTIAAYDVSTLLQDEVRYPDFTISTLGEPVGVAAGSDRLFVGTNYATETIVAFDKASEIPLVLGAIAGTETGGALTWNEVGTLGLDAAGALWVRGSGIFYFPDALILGQGATRKASFTHASSQLGAAAPDLIANRLFVSQTSGAGILVYESYSAATGDATASFTLDATCTAWALSIAADDLYAACDAPSGTSPAELRIWRGASSLSAARAPDVVIALPNGVSMRGGLLVVDDTLFLSLSSAARVYVFGGASSLTALSTPTHTITDAGSDPRTLELGLDGRLYVLDRDTNNVAVIQNAASAPSLFATLTGLASALDIALVQ